MPRKLKIIMVILIFLALQFKVLSWAISLEKKPVITVNQVAMSQVLIFFSLIITFKIKYRSQRSRDSLRDELSNRCQCVQLY